MSEPDGRDHMASRWNIRRDAIGTFLLFALGTGSLYALDILAASTQDVEYAASWAYSRSALLVGAGFAVFGIDQSVIRTRIPLQTLMRYIWPQALILSLPVLALNHFIDLPISSLSLYIACSSLAAVIAISGYLRATYRVSLAQLAMHGWKLILLTLVGATAFDMVPQWDVANVMALVLFPWSIALSGAASRYARRDEVPEVAVRQIAALYATGSRFLVFSLLAVSAAYLDQILLNATGSHAASAVYLQHTAALLPIPVFATGFIANLAGPYIRSRPGEVAERSTRITAVLVFVYVGVLLATIAAAFLLHTTLGFFETGFDFTLAAAILVIGALRYAVMVSGALVSVAGSSRQLTIQGCAGLISLGILGGTFMGLQSFGFRPERAIAVAVIGSLILRLGSGISLTRSVLRALRRY